MMVTSTRRRSVSFSQVCHQQKFSPLEKIPLERVERELEGEECRAFILPFCLCIPVLPSFPLAPLSALLLFFLPPHQRMETLMRFDSRWLPATPPPPFFLMTVWWLTFCWHNATKQDAEAFRRQVGGENKSWKHFRSTLSQQNTVMRGFGRHSPECQRGGGILDSELPLEIWSGRPVANSHVAALLWGRHSPRDAIVCFLVVGLITHEYFMVACSPSDKIPELWWRMLMMQRTALNEEQLY